MSLIIETDLGRTSVICETFRARGYSKVFLNTNCLIRHS